ncbi:universal stress protein [Lysobacter sp. ESA13C]|uniref:universal stress protein n=1 Tax=unclassified Lysobacter TaxID=2635362 RepID=UPI001CBE9C74|nr:universal stress protein [Lysobacter sp. ESA13C]
MFKDILVPLLMGDIPCPALRAACALASTCDGQVTALVGVSQIAPVAQAWKHYPPGIYRNMRECAMATTQAMADAARRWMVCAQVHFEISQSQEFWCTPGEICIGPARRSDLIVLGTIDGDEREARQRLLSEILLGSGRPVLIIPPSAPPPTSSGKTSSGKAVIAWKSSRESARALHDALPWLRQMRSVDLLMVDEEHEASNRHCLDALMIGHLENNGIQARLVRRRASAGQVGAVVAAHAVEAQADLLVAGGYSRSRLLEQVLGGTTRYLTEYAPVPTLLSH